MSPASQSIVYLIPSLLEENAIETIPPYIIDAIKNCQVIFAENERTARRFLKSIWKPVVINDYEWFAIEKKEEQQVAIFKEKIIQGKNIAIISEAGCPGVADPGQLLIRTAQKMNVTVKPLVGPSSVLLALMASGMNGQRFHFEGYLPIDDHMRSIKIKELEQESAKKNCTQIFIETPYRNNQLMDAVLKNCKPSTLICVAAELTSSREFIKTRSVAEWQKEKPDLHKKPVIFLMLAR